MRMSCVSSSSRYCETSIAVVFSQDAACSMASGRAPPPFSHLIGIGPIQVADAAGQQRHRLGPGEDTELDGPRFLVPCLVARGQQHMPRTLRNDVPDRLGLVHVVKDQKPALVRATLPQCLADDSHGLVEILASFEMQ